jgi:serine/threonine protein kinase
MVLYEMLAGVIPYKSEDPYQLILEKLSDDLPDVTTLRADVPPPIAAFVMKLVARDPQDRFQTATAALAGLPDMYA